MKLHLFLLLLGLLLAPSAFAASGTFDDVQTMSGWGSCSKCAGIGANGTTVPYYMHPWQSSPSLDGKSTEYHIGTGAPYSDVLWWKRLIGSTSVNTAARHFTYDTYFYVKTSAAVQALEFDINQFVGGHSYIFGTQCNVRAGNHWDIWDNTHSRWTSTGIYCAAPSSYQWHHVVVEVERTWDNKLHYVAITLDGAKHYVNSYWASTGTSWAGVTVNFQMDGNYNQAAYSTWLDKLKLTYW